VRQKRLTRIFAWQERDDAESFGKISRDVLHRMDREIDAIRKQRLFQLLGEEALPARIGERAILNAIAGRPDGDDLALDTAAEKRLPDHIRLRLREFRPACAYAERERTLRHDAVRVRGFPRT
jgi:hypothetical protein